MPRMIMLASTSFQVLRIILPPRRPPFPTCLRDSCPHFFGDHAFPELESPIAKWRMSSNPLTLPWDYV